VDFTVTAEQMMLFDTKWYVPTTEYEVFAGGQQPNQMISAPSNVLEGSFTVAASSFTVSFAFSAYVPILAVAILCAL
jgi:hypothetical protein